MNAQPDPPAAAARHEQQRSSRWGARLAALTAQSAAARIEPLNWQPPPRLWARIRRAAAVPAAAAAAVFLVIVLISVTAVWLRPHSINSSAAAAEPGLLAEADQFADPATAPAKPGSAASPVFVHVVGEVQRPGVYELDAGARVLAAIEAAGGATEHAVLDAVNLARPLADGEQIVIPNAQQRDAAALPGGGVSGAAAGGTLAAAPAAGGTVSLNTADAARLETLPRVGPALAQRIIDWRAEHGGFQSIEQLLNVSGIGQKTFEQLRDLVTL